MVRFQPWCMALQTRFKWRHKETDRWRRLMDATCVPFDWFGQTRGPTFTQFGGHWTHLLTCAHVVCPWDYPNYYPPEGPARFVSRITLADTMTQVRLVSLQGTAVYKHFTSNQHVYVHTNPRLDLCVLHAEQNLRRSGEMKMLWMQNEGYVIRPRLEVVEPLAVGDHVWIYGMTAHESLFDEEKGPEPLMIPTGIRAKVHALTREHFFLDTTSIEGEEKGRIGMGMCGSVVMRNGRCVGMLTATVHEESRCRELAGTAMCTYASDIFDFLLEVERQMKEPPPKLQREETVFQQRRHDEGCEQQQQKDWELDQSRLARHIPVPVSLWHMEEKWMTEEDYMTSTVFGRSGIFNQETQENTLGYDMNSAKSYGERPGDIAAFSTASQDGKPGMQGERKDYSPTSIYADHEDFKTRDVWDYNVSAEMRSLFDNSVDAKDAHSLNMMRKSLENIRAQRAMEKMKETVLKNPGRSTDPLNVGNMGRYDANSSDGGDAFDPAGADETPAAKRQREEEEYHEALRRRHGQKARPFGDEDLRGLWEPH
ncbi:hypothetical protein DQ04_08481020 [Trypanosoma grayi]|uniref:hypothetical protein n=1 Tax=Trypanosoma grayi TaxID=71804 RepID=UPI0004F3F5B4|nr:hypothetical protein DQ04_08481020 [Trypanosoma grayi]KEG07916.1 hypothetical protein DQ04_08481020 [Trypanosoma grayi]